MDTAELLGSARWDVCSGIATVRHVLATRRRRHRR